MTFELYIIYTTTFCRITGEAHQSPPVIPPKYRAALNKKGDEWERYVGHLDGDRVAVGTLLETLEGEGEEFEEWKEALEWFEKEDGFWVAWGY
jgi:hypothetical protein